MNGKRWIALAAAAGVLALAAGAAVAQQGTPSPIPGEDKKAAKGEYRELFMSTLAEELGVDRAKLLSAGRAAAEAVIAQAVKDGRISEERAKELRAKVAETKFFPFGMGFLHGRGHKMRGMHARGLGRIKQAAVEAAAKRLKMSVADLREQLRDGKTLSEIAKSKGVTDKQLGTAIAAGITPILDEMVKNDRLTRERANAILERLRSGELSLHPHKDMRTAA